MPKVLAIRHVAFEDLGCFEAALAAAGYQVAYLDVGDPVLAGIDPLAADLVVVLGGPIGAYEAETYPFLRNEIALLQQRLAADRPVLGICLGAQLIALALGARVYPGPRKEIGWAPVTLTDTGRRGPLAALDGRPVLHWHGDTFDLPPGCDLLASTDIYRNQAFSRGPRLLGLQFHVEVTGPSFERWLVGHACELAQAGIDPRDLRADAGAHTASLEPAGRAILRDWLGGLARASPLNGGSRSP